jgi:hypothetical protein
MIFETNSAPAPHSDDVLRQLAQDMVDLKLFVRDPLAEPEMHFMSIMMMTRRAAKAFLAHTDLLYQRTINAINQEGTLFASAYRMNHRDANLFWHYVAEIQRTRTI